MNYRSDALGYSRSPSFAVPDSPAAVKKAVLAWAADLGWRQRGPALSFFLEPLLATYLHVDVAILEEERGTTVVFTALVPSGPTRAIGCPYAGCR